MALIPKLEGQQCPPFTSPFPSPTLLGLGPLSLWCPPPRLELFPQRNATASPPVLDKPTQSRQPLLGVWDAVGALPTPSPPHALRGSSWVSEQRMGHGAGILGDHLKGVTRSFSGPCGFCVALFVFEAY
ncbi:unnamed protein product [Rangifer tarandus platyrhynchus]|uniref:Uncharacterized protein n=1 Tax=Rangifer tarandus platyrhynchus TaxID=3082113 RepID=A0ABN8ZXH4_RANTA|nr:unnamed protein product [Rangifer tarandus platyrhynchus]